MPPPLRDLDALSLLFQHELNLVLSRRHHVQKLRRDQRNPFLAIHIERAQSRMLLEVWQRIELQLGKSDTAASGIEDPQQQRCTIYRRRGKITRKRLVREVALGLVFGLLELQERSVADVAWLRKAEEHVLALLGALLVEIVHDALLVTRKLAFVDLHGSLACFSSSEGLSNLPSLA